MRNRSFKKNIEVREIAHEDAEATKDVEGGDTCGTSIGEFGVRWRQVVGHFIEPKNRERSERELA